MNTSLNIDKLKNKKLKILNENKLIYFSTVCDGRVKTRIVDYYNEGLRIGFITWTDSIKVQHIKRNPIVSLCIKNLQLEGRAKLMGHPGLAENKDFIESYKERHAMPYNNFIGMKNTTLIMVEPTLTIMMVYEANHFYLDHLDLSQETAYRKMLSPWNFDL